MLPTVPLAPPSSAIPPAAISGYTKEMEEGYVEVLKEALKRAKETNPNLKIQKELVHGDPAEKIIEVAKNGSFDLIVMGSKGRSGLTRFILGSVSDNVATEVETPIVLVK